MKKTFQYRIKGQRFRRSLDRQARAISYVWNYCNAAQKHAVRWGRRWPSRYDLQKLTAGCSKDLGLSAQSIQGVCERYVAARNAHGRQHLRGRNRQSLGWVPLTNQTVRQIGPDSFKFNGTCFRVWMSRPLGGRILCGSSFSQDALGNWYLNVVCQVPLRPSAATGAVGVDLGIKTAAVMSHGKPYDGGQFFREIEPKLAVAHRARKKKRARALHAKAKNRRKDALHKLSTRLVRENALVAVGNVSSQAIIKTRRAKGALDAGWGMFRTMLRYKAIAHAVQYKEVDEAYSSQVCSSCGAIPASAPKGLSGLGVRVWECSDCGALHDRDVNAAQNILALALGHQRPAEGTSVARFRRAA